MTLIKTPHQSDQPSLGAGDDIESVQDSDDEEVENLSDGDLEDLEGDEDVIRGRQKLHFVATITSLQMKPASVSRFFIPLCQMVSMPMVRPKFCRVVS